MTSNPPIYDGSEPLYMYRTKLDIYMRSLKTQRYDTILNFMNDLIVRDKKCVALMDFKNIDLYSLSSQHILSTIKKHTKTINEIFKKQINLENEDEEDSHECLILILKDLLYHIEFTLHKKVSNDISHYSLINKPSSKSSMKTNKRLSGESKNKDKSKPHKIPSNGKKSKRKNISSSDSNKSDDDLPKPKSKPHKKITSSN